MIRLFVTADLGAAILITLEADQAHYLTRVMRQTVGDELTLFNGRDGGWRARIEDVGKRSCRLLIHSLIQEQTIGPDIDLIIAIVKRSRLETIVEKATELGVRRIHLITTERTNTDHANLARLAAIGVEAAEQTGRLDAPVVAGPQPLAVMLADCPADRRLMFCDEAGDAEPAARALAAYADGPWSLLVGPEGGFSPSERTAVRALAMTVPVSLGPRILRADTAVIAALTLWQSQIGDWRGA